MMYDSNNAFKSYYKNASEKALLVNMLDKNFYFHEESISILDIGCHDGFLMTKILSQYASRLPTKVFLTGVDPSAAALTIYRDSHFGDNVVTTTFQGTAESFLVNNKNHYDWCLASQSLYWSANLADTVIKINNSCRSGLIVLRNEKGIYQIQSALKKYLGNRAEQLYRATNIKNVLNENNINYLQEDKSSYIDLPDTDSQEYRYLISFLLQRDEDCLPAEIYLAAKDYLTSHYKTKIQHDISYFWLGNWAN